MAWLGESFANLKGQISSFTREVLTDDDVDGAENQSGFLESPSVQNQRKRIRELEDLSSGQGIEIQFLKTQIHEREEAFDRQIKTIKESYQKLLDNKDEENQRLREQLDVLEFTFKQLESKKNASEEKLLALQLEGEAELRVAPYSEEKEAPVCFCDSATNTERNEYDEYYVRELDERCTSYQNELYLIRNELMAVQRNTDQLEESNAKIIHIFQSDFVIDGQPTLSTAKLKKHGVEENVLILNTLKELASHWRDLVEKKGLLERTVTKLSQKQYHSNNADDNSLLQISIPTFPTSGASSTPMNLDAFIPSKIDSFGLETILEEDRNDEESRSESGFISPGPDEATGARASSSRSRSPTPSPSLATLATVHTATTSSQTETELREGNEALLQSLAGQAQFKAEIESLQLLASNLSLREKELLASIDEKNVQIFRLELELQRLRLHLVETEDQFTTETLASEEKVKQLEGELSLLNKEYSQALQDNEPSKDVRDEIVRLTGERNEAWMQSSSFQDQIQKLTTQLQNLHFVLEQFQKEKETEIGGIERRCRADMNQLEQKNEVLRREIEKQESLLEKAKSGLDAAQELNAQIEERTRAIAFLKAQVQERDSELSKLKSQMEEVAKNLDGKIDRHLVKNLVVGYFATPADKRKEVLRVLATVLDFNREDRQKTSLESASIWPFSKVDSSTSAQVKQSLSEAFIHFLESESQPKVELRIPAEEITRRNSRSSGSSFGAPSTPPLSRMSPTLTNSSPPLPLNVSEMSMSIPVLSQVDRSNSILKDVLNPKP